MWSKQRWWNPGTLTLLYDSTCLKHISPKPRFWKGRIAVIRFSALLLTKTPVMRHFVYNPMLSKQRWWNPGSRTHRNESTCLKHISLQPRFCKGRIAAFQLLALLQQNTLVLRHFVYNPMWSKQRWWNPGNLTLLYDSTCLNHISPQPRFWKGRIAAIRFSALLLWRTPVMKYFVYNPMLKSTRLRHISLQPWCWKGRIDPFSLLALLQQKALVLRHFAYNPMLSKQRWWNPGSRTHRNESTCLRHISQHPWCWKGRIAAFEVLALIEQKTLVLRHLVYNPMLSKHLWWNPGSRTLL
ncbi:hypothetical protein ANTQUA_LOCUS6912 [Anthophora quadrimaculata]